MSSNTSSDGAESCQAPLAILASTLKVPHITTVRQPAVFNYYGMAQESALDAAAEFLASHTNAPHESASALLQSFLETTQADCVGDESEKAAFWLTIRLKHPNDSFKVPRWHQDGLMYPYDEGREVVARSKYATTLLGPHTLLLPAKANVFDTIKRGKKQFLYWRDSPSIRTTQEERDLADKKLRLWLVEQYKGEKRVEPKLGEVVRFSWGRDDSPVHSEPEESCERVFITIIYGSEKEMQGMCKFRGTVYDRPDVYKKSE